ncbi:MAG: hypothetical protein RIR88_284, partial [Actinomycetota bacterium]
ALEIEQKILAKLGVGAAAAEAPAPITADTFVETLEAKGA